MRIRIMIAAHTRANLDNLAHNLKLTLQGNGMVERDPTPIIEITADEVTPDLRSIEDVIAEEKKTRKKRGQ